MITIQQSINNRLNRFEVTSGLICITDPCYDKTTWCGNFDLPAVNGTWHGIVEYEGNRVKQLQAKLFQSSDITDTDNPKMFSKWENLPNEVGVDSGQAGIFCSSIYPIDKSVQGEYGDVNTFYGKCCDATIKKNHGIIDGKGVVSSSGYGDGGYQGKCKKNLEGKIVAIKIKFL